MKNQNPNFKIQNGDEVVSNISGFKGIVTSSSCHLNGCNRYWASPPIDKDGKLPEGYWFDENELSVIKKTKVKPVVNDDPGGFPSSIK